MKKQTYENECPCGDREFKLTYQNSVAIELYCPFCGVQIEDVNLNLDNDDEEEDDE